jgi:hypothetical protein
VIIPAIHGKPLFKSGKRAARLLWANLMDTISLDVVGEFIMICALILLTVVTAGIGITVHIVTVYKTIKKQKIRFFHVGD